MGISIETLALARKYANTISKDRSVNQEFLDGFVVDGTTKELCKSITGNKSVRPGHSFMGAVTLTDMPFKGNAECKIDVIESSIGGYILALELISATEAPYRWHGTYWNEFDGWKGVITSADVEPKEDKSNKVTAISDASTDTEYPSAKAVNDALKAQKNDITTQFGNALKGKVTGNNAVRINDSSPIEHEMNVRVSSKNLIPYPYSWFGGATEKTVKGVTLIVNDDGSITLNGTATGEFDVAFLKSPISAMEGVYTLSGTPTGTSTTYYLQAVIDNKYGGISASGKETPQYNVSKGQKIARIVLYVKPGAVFNNLVVKPQFERGNVATDYTRYVDPASVTLTQRGKNLLPYTYASYNSAGAPNTLTNNGITYTLQSDKSVIANGTVTDKQSQFFYSDAAALKLPNYNIYTLSANNNGSQNTYYNRMEFVATDGSGNYAQNVTTKPMSLTQSQAKRPNSGTYCKFYAYENTKLNNVTLYPQIELGDTYTGYEPVLPAITLTPSADGTVTGVNNIYPTTTLLANKDNVVIDVEYNRDINKAFEELQNAILAQGSNT